MVVVVLVDLNNLMFVLLMVEHLHHSMKMFRIMMETLIYQIKLEKKKKKHFYMINMFKDNFCKL